MDTIFDHRRSLRLPDYDYSQEGAYFVTICTYNRRPLFGEILAGEMHLNATGRVAAAQWLLLANRFTNLELGEWVIMPNHIHGILVITSRGEASPTKLSVPTNPLVKDASPLRPTWFSRRNNSEFQIRHFKKNQHAFNYHRKGRSI